MKYPVSIMHKQQALQLRAKSKGQAGNKPMLVGQLHRRNK